MERVNFKRTVPGITSYTRCPFGYLVPSALPWVALVGHFYCKNCPNHISLDYQKNVVECSGDYESKKQP